MKFLSPLHLDHFFLLILCGLLYLPFLGTAPLWDYDEGYFATIAKEMCEKGTWIVPSYNDVELGDKPILIFWGMILSMKLFGTNEFAARFPTVLWGIGTVLLTYHLARRLFQSRSHGLRAGLILATMLLFCVQTRGTTCDGAMLFFQCATLTVYVFGCRGFNPVYKGQEVKEQENGGKTDSIGVEMLVSRQLAPWFPQNPFLVCLLYGLLAFSILAKGPAPFILIVAVLGLFLLIKSFQTAPSRSPSQLFRRFFQICWFMRPLTAIGMGLLVAGPWFFLVGWYTNGDWIKLFFIEHNVARTVSSTRSHTGFPFFYTLTSPFGTFPWSIFLLPFFIDLVRRLWKKARQYDAYLFAVCWMLLFYVFFGLVSTKLIHYVFPAYPALAILGSVFLLHWRNATDWAGKYWDRIIPGVLPIVGIGMLIAFAFLLPKYFPDIPSLYILPAFILCAGLCGALAFYLKGRPGYDLTFNVFAVLFTLLLFQFCVVQIDPLGVQQKRLIFPDRPEQGPAPLLITVGIMEPSWIFYYDSPIWKIELDDLQELNLEDDGTPLANRLRNYFIREEQERQVPYIPNEKRWEMLKGPIFLLTTRRDFDREILALFGDAACEIKREQAFLKNFDLVLYSLSP